MAANPADVLLRLEQIPDAIRRPRRSSGLYHIAILVPDRAALGRSLRRLAEREWPLAGASDRLVSEALYLDDPDGLGIEIYRDRPRDTWRFEGTEVAMATEPLDLNDIAREPGADQPWTGLDAGTRIGHVHLHVPELQQAEALYCNSIGFTPTLRTLSGRAVRGGGRLSPSSRPERVGWGRCTSAARTRRRVARVHHRGAGTDAGRRPRPGHQCGGHASAGGLSCAGREPGHRYPAAGSAAARPLAGRADQRRWRSLRPCARVPARGAGAGLRVESAKGECNYGQHEIAFRYADALATADGHVIYKNGAKEIAAQDGCSLTFMSKYNEREGNSCHIHFSVRAADGDAAVMAGDGQHGYSELMEQFVAGQLACLRELTLFLAPNVNSYKRFAAGSFAPTAVAWGHDNRTCALRVVGHGHGLRLENRVPGGDVNPYLALAAIIAAGLHGVDKGLALEDEFTGNAYVADKPSVPRTLREARDLFADSELARQAFGAEVVDHYTNMATVELDAFDAAVTDWERFRGFERL